MNILFQYKLKTILRKTAAALEQAERPNSLEATTFLHPLPKEKFQVDLGELYAGTSQ
jgi:hypothetical protein